jgi:hypothetical protein
MSASFPVPLSTQDERRAASRYVLNHYSWLLTLEEKMAYKHLVGERKINATESPAMRQMMRKVFQTDDVGVQAIVAGGEDSFFDRIVVRIMSEHGDRIVWNLCPKCCALTRTPRACLCPVCSHTWYERRQKN